MMFGAVVEEHAEKGAEERIAKTLTSLIVDKDDWLFILVSVTVNSFDMHTHFRGVFTKVGTRNINFGILINMPQKVELDIP